MSGLEISLFVIIANVLTGGVGGKDKKKDSFFSLVEICSNATQNKLRLSWGSTQAQVVRLMLKAVLL